MPATVLVSKDIIRRKVIQNHSYFRMAIMPTADGACDVAPGKAGGIYPVRRLGAEVLPDNLSTSTTSGFNSMSCMKKPLQLPLFRRIMLVRFVSSGTPFVQL